MRFLAEQIAEAEKIRSGRAERRGGNVLASELLPRWLDSLPGAGGRDV